MTWSAPSLAKEARWSTARLLRMASASRRFLRERVRSWRARPPPGVPEHWCVHALWTPPDGDQWRVYSLYVHPTAGEDTAFAIMRAVLADAQQTPHIPTLVVGDLNQELEGHPLEEVYRLHGWHSPLAGVPTSLAADPPRRIDWMLYNRAAGHRAGSARMDWSLGLWVHGAPAHTCNHWAPCTHSPSDQSTRALPA